MYCRVYWGHLYCWQPRLLRLHGRQHTALKYHKVWLVAAALQALVGSTQVAVHMQHTHVGTCAPTRAYECYSVGYSRSTQQITPCNPPGAPGGSCGGHGPALPVVGPCTPPAAPDTTLRLDTEGLKCARACERLAFTGPATDELLSWLEVRREAGARCRGLDAFRWPEPERGVLKPGTRLPPSSATPPSSLSPRCSCE